MDLPSAELGSSARAADPVADPRETRLRRSLDTARRALVATGPRNRLVHTPRAGSRAHQLEIVGASADAVFAHLVRERRAMAFLPAAKDGMLMLPPPDPRPAPAARAARQIRDPGLQTRLAPDALQKRVIGLLRDARTLEEEQGVNILYLAIGFLRWYEDPKSETPREAPLILLPVALVREEGRSTARLVCREDDLAANLPLHERLRQDFALTLPEMPEGEEWGPSDYFAAVLAAVASEPRWTIDADGIVLGFFSFAKQLMYRDLEPETWPGHTLLSHPVVGGLLVDGFAAEDPQFPEDVALDAVLDPADLVHVVDADASQALVVESVRSGRNLVVQGPPGTGKSQTIANIIASAVHDGRTVLFVAEKMAALEVVHDRLAKAGLRDLCLELHSRQANKRAAVAEIGRTLQGTATAATAADDEADALRLLRDGLNREAARLHRTLAPSGLTPYEALGIQVKLAQEGHPPPALALADAPEWSPAVFADLLAKVERLAELTARAGPLAAHPWAGVAAPALQPTDRQRLAVQLDALAAVAAEVESAVDGVSALLGIALPRTLGLVPGILTVLRLVGERPPGPAGLLEALVAAGPDLRRLDALARAGSALAAAERDMATLFVPGAARTIEDEAAWRADIAAGAGFPWARLRPRYRRASRRLAALMPGELPRLPAERAALVERALRAHALHAALAAEADFAASALGALWQGEASDFAALAAALAWLQEIASALPGVSAARCVAASRDGVDPARLADGLAAADAALHRHAEAVARILALDLPASFGVGALAAVPLAAFAGRARDWAANGERLDEWARLSLADRLCREAGGGALAAHLADGRLAPERAAAEFLYARAEAVWKAAVAADPELALVDGEDRSRAVARFRALEERRRTVVADCILAAHRARMPKGGMGDMAVIRGEIGRQRGHMSIRRLIERAGRTLQQIKPVFLMSPLSVAQFLPPGSVAFDLLVIDEASQVRPEDALGAIARTRQIVVVGDKKQLPPTNFFERLVNGEDEETEEADAVPQSAPLAGAAAAAALESILSLCEARGMPDRMLNWHYRSRHPSLIAVSNDEFYDGRLFLPPSPCADRGTEGLVVRRVAGAYDRGVTRTNPIEAQALLAAVARHARGAHAAQSLGIVTFSSAQRDLIEDLLEAERRRDPTLDAFLGEKRREAFFVKNLENVQGDERDIVLVSVGYGPRLAGSGLDSMAFGPVSREGGARRLNVLFTRARVRCEVFASFDAADIDLARTTQDGARILKRFLRYAETGTLDLPAPTGIGAESPFEEAVAQAIRALGYEFDLQVGSAGFRIDLAVKDPARPGRYVLAVECDGATYHRARWARERDRLRQDVLENLGWTVYRIWSTDWFRRPAAECQKLAAAIARACAAAPAAPAPRNLDLAWVEPAGLDHPGAAPAERPEDGGAAPYHSAALDIVMAGEPHEAPVATLAALVGRIVAAEGPIHEDEIARRLARLYGKSRTGPRIAEAVGRGLAAALRHGTVAREGAFWSAAGTAGGITVRSRAEAPPALRRADKLPPAELRAAIHQSVHANGALAYDEVPVAVTRLLGLHRTGTDLRAVVAGLLGEMIGSGQLVAQGGSVRLP